MKESYSRKDCTFFSNNTKCSAWLYLPEKDKKCPIIVMAHGFGAVRSMNLDKCAETFADAGYASLLFDYRNLGTSGGNKRQLIKAKDQIEDWNCAVDYVKTLDNVDTSKIILFGVSFSGGHVITLSAKRNDITASIVLCPYTSGRATRHSKTFKSIKPVIPKLLLDLLSCLKKEYKPVMIKIEGKVGEASIIQVESGKETSLSNKDETSGYKNEIAARSALEVFKYSPGKYTKKIKTPIYYAICKNDKVAPAKITKYYAEKSINGTIKEYDCGHFEIFQKENFNKSMKDYIEFLDKNIK